MACAPIPGHRRRRGQQRDRDHHRRPGRELRKRRPAAAQAVQEPAAEKRAFDDRRVFELDRHAHERHRREPQQEHPPGVARPVGPERRGRGGGGEQVVDHGGLPAVAVERVQDQEVGERRHERGAVPGRSARHGPDQARGPRHARRDDELVLDDALAAQRADARVEEEQPHRLAVPQVHIRELTRQEAVADEEVELLVEAEDRIAEGHGAGQQRGEQDRRDGPPSAERPERVRGGDRERDARHGTRAGETGRRP